MDRDILRWIGAGFVMVILLSFIIIGYSQMAILTGEVRQMREEFSYQQGLEGVRNQLLTQLLAACMEQGYTDLRLPGEGVFCSGVVDGQTVVVPLDWEQVGE